MAVGDVGTVIHKDAYVTAIEGDCLEVMRDMASNSIDAIITDPPYGLTKIDERKTRAALEAWMSGQDTFVPDGRGFMGKEWDKFVPPPAVWKEALRVLKPGGYLLCFAGSRTIDLMTASIRMGGFNIRDSLEWLYGCLTPDVEALTPRGWVSGMDVRPGDLVAQVDISKGSMQFKPVLDYLTKTVSEPLVDIDGEGLSVSVTPNHRIPLRIDDRFVAEYAGDAADRLREPCEHLAAVRLGGESSLDLDVDEMYALGAVLALGFIDADGTVSLRLDGLEGGQCHQVRDAVQRFVRHDSLRTANAPVRLPSLVEGYVRDVIDGNEPAYGLFALMDQSQIEALWRGARDASGGEMSAVTMEAALWLHTAAHLCGRISEPIHSRAGRYMFTVRETNTYATTVSVQSTDYEGQVWCLATQSGAFLARRAGRIFVSMNSGFPKSMNVAYEMDKASGYVGEVIGTETVDVGMQGGQMHAGRPRKMETRQIRALSPEAAVWRGWGTSLKPGHEPIVVAQKPLLDVEDKERQREIDGVTVRLKYHGKAGQRERPTYQTDTGESVEHSTVKPVGLMEHLVRLVTDSGEVVLDPFVGSGSTCEAATLAGRDSVGIELDPVHAPLIRERLRHEPMGGLW